MIEATCFKQADFFNVVYEAPSQPAVGIITKKVDQSNLKKRVKNVYILFKKKMPIELRRKHVHKDINTFLSSNAINSFNY